VVWAPPFGVSIAGLSGVSALWDCVSLVCGGGGGCAGGGVLLGAVGCARAVLVGGVVSWGIRIIIVGGEKGWERPGSVRERASS